MHKVKYLSPWQPSKKMLLLFYNFITLCTDEETQANFSRTRIYLATQCSGRRLREIRDFPRSDGSKGQNQGLKPNLLES